MALDPYLGLFALAGALAIIGGIIVYVYQAWALRDIGKRLKKFPEWLAWIPIVNLFYVAMVAGYEWYFGFLWVLVLVPTIGTYIAIALTIWFWWKISEARKRPGWWGILLAIPIVQWVFMGILAWSKK